MIPVVAILMGQIPHRSDRRIDPPAERTFVSAGGHYRLRVFTDDAWKTREPFAELKKGSKTVWKHRIPNSHGPRDAVVLDTGRVVLLDEWINVASARAITLLSPKGVEETVFSYHQIHDALDLPPTSLSSHARTGPYGRGTWLAGHPIVRGETIELPAGGEILVFNLNGRTLRRKD